MLDVLSVFFENPFHFVLLFLFVEGCIGFVFLSFNWWHTWISRSQAIPKQIKLLIMAVNLPLRHNFVFEPFLFHLFFQRVTLSAKIPLLLALLRLLSLSLNQLLYLHILFHLLFSVGPERLQGHCVFTVALFLEFFAVPVHAGEHYWEAHFGLFDVHKF